MVQKFISKHDKRAHDNEKRKESLKRKFEEKLSNKEIIKNALSLSSAKQSKKIIFDEDTGKSENEEKLNGNLNETEDKLHLFDESDDEEVKYEIKIRDEFEGKKGHKLLNLQSNYNNDDRFKLDERFYDEEESDDNEKPFKENDVKEKKLDELEEEKVKQLKILENVLGQPIQTKEKNEKKSKKSFVEMVRFDASNKDHRRQDDEVTEEPKGKKKLDREERKKKRKESNKEKIEKESKTAQTSDEKFYKVSDNLKLALKNRNNENKFSLLSTFSRNDDEPVEWGSGSDNEDYERENEEVIPVSKEEGKTEATKVQGIKKEKFFFTADDPRIEEGLSFINMKNSEEAKKVLENYDSARRDIREVLRLRWQKHRQRNNPFKKKIGGSSKKLNKNRRFFGKRR